MDSLLTQIQALVGEGKARVSEHGYDGLAAEGLTVSEVTAGLAAAELIEDYPDYPKGPCVLVLQYDSQGRAIHAVWGIPRGYAEPAVLITAYRPAPERWSEDFRRRRP